MSWRNQAGFAVAGAILLSQIAFSQEPSSRPVPPGLLAQMARQGQASYLVVLRDRADLTPAPGIGDRIARGRFVYRALKHAADSSQRALLDYLKTEASAGRARRVRSFVGVNAIGVTSNEASLRRLAAFPQVERIIELPALSVPPPMAGSVVAGDQQVEWNVAKVRAPEVWARGFTGQGIVVASIDTGVEFTHSALVNQYRGHLNGGAFDHNYNWWDATDTCALAPCDDNEHGTHTTGTMVGSDSGSNRIGVAPGATWIACKALKSGGGGSVFDLLECGDWVLAPWDLHHQNPDPDRRPHIVNNSWGFSFGGVDLLETMVSNWRAAGIFPAFAAGNSGPLCGTAISPGDYTGSFATGAADMDDSIANFSSRGPSMLGGVTKPDVTAPGVNVRSSVPGNAYASYSGTSMASPHTAGVVALLWSEFPNLSRDVLSTERKLRPAAAILNSTQPCGGNGPTDHPNNTFGWGRIDAVRTEQPFSVQTNRSVYRTGDQLKVDVSLVNPFSTVWTVDAYFGMKNPAGRVVLKPFGTISIPPSLEVFDAPQISVTLTDAHALGPYMPLTVLAQPGSDPTNPANIISVDRAPFRIQ